MGKVAAIQMCSGSSVPDNLEVAARLVEQAVKSEAELIVLPENFALMPRHESDRLDTAEADRHGPIQEFLADIARRQQTWLIGGTLPITAAPGGQKVYAACMVYDPAGERVARYDKIHLFDVTVSDSESYRESEFFEAGSIGPDNQMCIDTPVGRIGLTICYDVRFPELYRTLSSQGATLFSVPSAFTVATGKAHWQTLLRARAIENQAFLIAPGQCGPHDNGRKTYGHSMIIDPWGRVMNQLTSETEGVVMADIDNIELNTIRSRFPSLEHRRI